MNDSSDLPVPAQPLTRRQMLVGTTAVLTGLGFGPLSALAHTEEGVSRAAESIHQEPVFKANPKRVYEALTDEKQFEKVTQFSAAIQSGAALGNKPTQIAPNAGGPFIYSIVKFELTRQDSGTKIIFDHAGFPQGKGQPLADGWKANYWGPLEKYLM